LEFSESLLASTILSKIEAIHLIYTVQIVPRTDMVRISRPTAPCTVQILPKTYNFISGTVTLPYSTPFNRTVRVD
jgi:hypothetical protein